MKPIYSLYLLFGISFVLSGCTSAGSAVTPSLASTSLPSSTVSTSTPAHSQTPTSSPSPTETPTRLPTLEPAEASEAIKTLLQEPVDCEAPCFWGIMPGQTTFGEAVRAITHFGLQLLYTNTLDDKEFRQSEYVFDSGLSINVILTLQNKIVENLRVYISPEKQEAGVPREWLAYSPETLISRYGSPSKVDFFFGGAAPNPSYAMDVYFDSKDLIIEYYSYDLGPNMQVCPLTNQMDSVRVWMGKNPVNPPPNAVLLEEATSLTMEEFAELMMGVPDGACFNLKKEAFQ